MKYGSTIRAGVVYDTYDSYIDHVYTLLTSEAYFKIALLSLYGVSFSQVEAILYYSASTLKSINTNLDKHHIAYK